MNERLWSPAMRKWVKDAQRHGLQIGWEKIAKPKLRLDEAGQLRASGVTVPAKVIVEGVLYFQNIMFYKMGLH